MWVWVSNIHGLGFYKLFLHRTCTSFFFAVVVRIDVCFPRLFDIKWKKKEPETPRQIGQSKTFLLPLAQIICSFFFLLLSSCHRIFMSFLFSCSFIPFRCCCLPRDSFPRHFHCSLRYPVTVYRFDFRVWNTLNKEILCEK